MIDSTIRAIAEHLGRSGPWHQRFKDLQEVFTETFLELQGIHNIRWLSRGDDVARFVAVLPAVITMLKEWNEQLYTVVTSYRFHFLLFFLSDVLDQMNLDLSAVHAQIRRTTGHLKARYVDCGDEFGGGLSPKLSPWLEKHGPDGTRDVCIEGVYSDEQSTTFTFTLHEDWLDDYPGPGHHDPCLDICTEFAELIVANLLDRLGDLDKLSGVRLFTPDHWSHGRHERHAKCQEWLESLITLFRADESDDILPGIEKKKVVKELRLLIPFLAGAPKKLSLPKYLPNPVAISTLPSPLPHSRPSPLLTPRRHSLPPRCRLLLPSRCRLCALAPNALAPSALTPSALTFSALAPSALAPNALAPITLAPSALAPSALVPSALAPSTLAPNALALRVLAPSALAPNAQAPRALAPNALAPSALAPNAQAPNPQAPRTLAPIALAPIPLAGAYCAG
ncbi:unnamed protein product [Closterium sp. Naga37s-1]|nr:unnamed protein product [Closterium sp. Naga37s-1]